MSALRGPRPRGVVRWRCRRAPRSRWVRSPARVSRRVGRRPSGRDRRSGGSAGGRVCRTTTNEIGAYRFPRVPPGTYVGGREARRLQPGRGAERHREPRRDRRPPTSPSKSAPSPRRSASSAKPARSTSRARRPRPSITAEQIELLPKGRDFTAIATQAAGAAQEGFLGGLSIDGASGSENRFVIDGVDTTHPQDGTSGQNLVTDFVEEVQVKSAGYPAEYGGSVGGVINAVTKSGTNEFKGWVGVYYGDSSWDGDERPTPYRSDPTLYRTFDEGRDHRHSSPASRIGGPIVQDNAWFYVGYTYTDLDIDRTPDGARRRRPARTSASTSPATSRATSVRSSSTRCPATSAPREIDGNLPARTASTPASADLSVVDRVRDRELLGLRRLDPVGQLLPLGPHRLLLDRHERQRTRRDRADLLPHHGLSGSRAARSIRPAGFLSFPGNSHDHRGPLGARGRHPLDGNLFVNGARQPRPEGRRAVREHQQRGLDRGEAVNLYTFRWGLAGPLRRRRPRHLRLARRPPVPHRGRGRERATSASTCRTAGRFCPT